jgi:hypothetical protein
MTQSEHKRTRRRTRFSSTDVNGIGVRVEQESSQTLGFTKLSQINAAGKGKEQIGKLAHWLAPNSQP